MILKIGEAFMKSANTKKYVLSIICILIGVGIGLANPPALLTAESMRYLGIFMTAVLLLIFQLYPAPLMGPVSYTHLDVYKRQRSIGLSSLPITPTMTL